MIIDGNGQMNKRLSMGKKFNSHFGYVELPSEILEVGIFDNHMEFDCEDGVYHVYRNAPNPLKVVKVYDRKVKDD